MSFNGNEMLNKIEAKYKNAIAYAQENDMIPYIGDQNRWLPSPHEGNTWWTGGFWPAIMWQLYHFCGNDVYADEARRVQKLLRYELINNHQAMHHDVGFMYKLSFGADNLLFPSDESRQIVLQCADVLAGRFNPNGFIKAWNGADRCGWAIVDCMMNLPLLYWASAQSGDPRYKMIADLHAQFCMRYFVRADGSCNHIVISNPETGEVLGTPAGQGYAEGSSWSRGQAWALYGFALAYENTGKTEYLDTAKQIAHYFIANIRSDGLVNCDFRQPKTEEKLDNIAGACAASGLLLLKTLVPEYEKDIYYDAAVRMIKAMDQLCSDYSLTRYGVLSKCTAAYHGDDAGTHVNIVYGDYFLIEALLRLEGKALPLWGLK